MNDEKLHGKNKFCRFLLQMNAYDIYYRIQYMIYVCVSVCAAFRFMFQMKWVGGKPARMKNCTKKVCRPENCSSSTTGTLHLYVQCSV